MVDTLFFFIPFMLQKWIAESFPDHLNQSVVLYAAVFADG